jgi:hypothetical protein
MKIIKICSTKPGIYIRRQIIYLGEWVTIKGAVFWPQRRKIKKWAGLAAVIQAGEPQPIPTQYKRHGENHESPYKIDYNPARQNTDQEGKG